MSSARTLPVAASLPWLVVTLVLAALAAMELNRVASGELFLFSTSFDSSASVSERYDARASARTWRIPAILTVLCCGGLCYALRRQAGEIRRPASGLVAVFLLATAFDLITTLWFFHEDGIDLEVHPGVRLLAYAYGRTAGPMLAKAIQAAGVLALAVRLPGLTKPLLIGTSTVYTLAALYNVLA